MKNKKVKKAYSTRFCAKQKIWQKNVAIHTKRVINR